MGVRGLTDYVDTLPSGEGKVWESFDLHDTNLVIDGCGLYYYIYTLNELNMKFGGQYHQLENTVKEFFSKLRSNNVVPYVVIDGIKTGDDKKFQTHIKRKKECIKRVENLWTSKKCNYNAYAMVLPRLTQLAVVQVLQEIKVPYAVADFEADCEIASLANALDAPVLANDSDFFIFNIKRGYIPFQQYNFSGTSTTVKKFNFDGFAKHLGMDPSMSPLLASLVGNDYVNDIMLRPFTDHIQTLVSSSKLEAGGKKSKIPPIAQFLSRYKSVSEAIHAIIGLFSKDQKLAFKKALHLSVEEYQMKQSNLIGYFASRDLSCTIRTYNGHSLPEWVVKLYREGLFASEALACLCNRKIFLRTQCEDTSLPSAQNCVEGLRWYYYVLALNCEDTSMAVPGTRLQSQSKASKPSMVTDGQSELEVDFDHTLASGFTPESQRDIKGYNDTSSPLAVLLTNLQKLGKAGIPESGPTDHIHTSEPTPESQRETECCVMSPSTEKQSKDSITNMVTGQSEFQTESETTRYDTSPSTSHAQQIKDPDYTHTILESEFAHKFSLSENTVKSEGTEVPSSCDHTINNVKFRDTDNTPQTTTNDIIVTELDREGSTLVQKKVNLTRQTPEINIQIQDIPKMSDEAKKNHLLSLLDSNLPFIHDLPIHHQIMVAALRYWIIHSQVKPAHLAALLVYYVGVKQSSTKSKSLLQVSVDAVHRFSQWQNVLYWVEQLKMLFSTTFPQLQVAKLYDGEKVCSVYQRLRVVGIKIAESFVTNTNLYRYLYDVITTDLPRDCQFNQSRSSEGQQNKGGRTLEQGKEKKSKSSDCLKGNKFALLCASDSDEDSVSDEESVSDEGN